MVEWMEIVLAVNSGTFEKADWSVLPSEIGMVVLLAFCLAYH